MLYLWGNAKVRASFLTGECYFVTLDRTWSFFIRPWFSVVIFSLSLWTCLMSQWWPFWLYPCRWTRSIWWCIIDAISVRKVLIYKTSYKHVGHDHRGTMVWPKVIDLVWKKNHWLKVLSEFLAMEITLDEIIPDIPKQEVIDPTDGFTNQVIIVRKKTACHTLSSQLFWEPMITGHWSLLILVVTVHTVRSVPKNRRQSQIGK